MIVLAFDPGETTGYALLDSDSVKILTMNSFTLTHLQHIETLLKPTSFTPTVVVLEQFKLYPGAAKHKVWSSFPTVEVIGVIKYLAGRWGIPVVEQSAADAKFIRLKRTKEKRGDRHAYSALRHALLYLRRQGADGEFRDLYNLRPRRVPKALGPP